MQRSARRLGRRFSSKVSRAGTATLKWLSSAAPQICAGAATAQLRAVVLCGLCRDIGSRHASQTRDLARRFVDVVERRSVRALVSSGAVLGLLGYRAALRFNLRPRVLAEYAQAVADALSGRNVAAAGDEGVAATLLLWRLGLAREPRPPALRIDLRSMIGGKEGARSTLDVLESATAFGTAAITVSDAVRDALDGALLAGLQDYDLDFACRAARVRGYVSNGPGLAVQTARAFLLSNQDIDGSFGFFEREIAALRAKRRGVDPVLRLKLPVTLACLWTLAETDDANYRLLRDLGEP